MAGMGDQPSRRDATRQLVIDNVDRFVGARCLYREGTRVSLVRVESVEPGDAGIRASVALVPTRGLYNNRPESWGIYSAWDVFGFSLDRWDAAYISLTMYFESGLIDAVLRWCEGAWGDEYDEARYDHIGRCIRKYRRAKLARQLSPELKLVLDGRHVGAVTEHHLNSYPEIHGKFTAIAVAPEMQHDLSVYARWWDSDLDDDPPITQLITGKWSLETSAGVLLPIDIPHVDFGRGTIECTYRGGVRTAGDA
jgi:hypothetical protein